MTTTKHVIYAGSADSELAELTLHSTIQLHSVGTIREVFSIVSKQDFSTELTIIDINILQEVNGILTANQFDILNTLLTLMQYTDISNQDGSPICARPALVLAVDATTDPVVIKQVLNTVDIRGIFPQGDQFTSDDRHSALADLLSGMSHTPKKIQQLLTRKKPTQKHSDITTITTLTPRQHQIFSLVTTRGASNKSIAKMLHITDSTVKLHMTAILKKCGVRTRTQLAVFTREHDTSPTLISADV